MHPVELAANIVSNACQHLFIDFRRYGFTVTGSPKCKAMGYCLAVLAKRHLESHPGVFPCLDVLRDRPDLLLSAARIIPLTGTCVQAFINLAVAMIRNHPTRYTMRTAFVSLVLVFVRLGNLNPCFGYVNHPRHKWPGPIYGCLNSE
uniref:NS7b protein n=1 Tax=Eidolon bat coronavirus TaxID=2717680 RepID=A0AB38ZDP7_9NIDO